MFHQESLFDLPIHESSVDEQSIGKARLRKPQRKQTDFILSCLDNLIPPDHIARTIWDIVSNLDLSIYTREIKAVEGEPGSPAITPRLLLGLWILATIEGIGSARTLERYSREHTAFIWMCGGVSVNYHTLSDFRNEGSKFETVLTQIVGSLIQQGVVSTETWAQDGMRVRANAGTGSFRREKSLEEAIEVSHQRLNDLKKNAQSDAQCLSNREKAAKERAARERLERCEAALEVVNQQRRDIDKRKLSKKDKKKAKENARASITDPEAKKMKMANGGYNPAYNVQYITDIKSRIITGVQTITSASDKSLMSPMINQIFDAYQQVPGNLLVDGGYVAEGDLNKVEEFGVTVFMPVSEQNQKKHGTGLPLPGGSVTMGRWVERMQTKHAKDLYKNRASSAEFSNASTRNKGFYQFGVRGHLKANATSMLFALTHNIERIISMIKSGCNILLSFT